MQLLHAYAVGHLIARRCLAVLLFNYKIIYNLTFEFVSSWLLHFFEKIKIN